MELDFIKNIIKLHFPKAKILAFGSRVTGTPKKYSDIDLCLNNQEPLELSQLAFLKEALEESDLPYIVDISDYHRITDDFRKNIIEQKAIEL